MTTSQTGDDCQTNDLNNLFPIESLRFPIDSSMRIVFTGFFNGFNVEVRSVDEVSLLYHMGCFGKGSSSRSKPRVAQSDDCPSIMRKRQFMKRNYWYKKYGSSIQKLDSDTFFMDIDELTARIISDSEKQAKRDVIDLVSSDDDMSETNDIHSPSPLDSIQTHEKDDFVVIVPNSDSEDENYFANMKPKCCINKVNIQEKLILTLQEAFFLLYGLGCLQIVNSNKKILDIQQCWDLFTQTDKNFIPKYVVYHYFRSKGYVVKPGIKFGGDYLLYKDGPGKNHAEFIVIIKCCHEDSSWISVLGHVRMGSTTVKEIIVAEVFSPNEEPKQMPEQLNLYSVQEVLLSRKLPVSINTDE